MYKNHVINKPTRVIAALIPLALAASLSLGTLASAAPEDDADDVVIALEDEAGDAGDLVIMPLANGQPCDPQDPDEVWVDILPHLVAPAPPMQIAFVNHDVEISMTLSNEAYDLYYTVNGSPDLTLYTGPFTISAEGQQLVAGIPMCGDTANTFGTHSMMFGIDKTAPVITRTFEDDKVVLKATDSLSGVRAIFYTSDAVVVHSYKDGDFSKWTEYTEPFDPPKCPTFMSWVAVDMAGNISDQGIILIDGACVLAGGTSTPSLSLLLVGLSIGLVTVGSMGLWYRRLALP